MKIVVRMRGGLGNQMFQYAYARALQENNSDIILDTREYKDYSIRNFELSQFKLNKDVKISEDVPLPYDLYIKAYRLYQFLYFKVKKKRPMGYLESFARRGYILSGRACELPNIQFPNDIYLYGYFQSAKPLLEFREMLFNEFKATKTSVKVQKIISNIDDDTVAVSIRRGEDYKTGGWPVQSKEYYLNGLKKLNSDSKRKIIVFSDNIESVIEENWFVNYENVEYIEKCSPTEQMEIMKQCKYFVISNSSFAWWGSFLGSYRGGAVIAPEYWYENNVKTVETQLQFPEMSIM